MTHFNYVTSFILFYIQGYKLDFFLYICKHFKSFILLNIMFKTLLSFIALAIGLSCAAFGSATYRLPATANAQTAAQDSIPYYSYSIRQCGVPGDFKRFVDENAGTYSNYDCYVHVPADMATKYAGSVIDRIVFSCIVRSKETLSGSIYITEDLTGTPVTEKSVAVRNTIKDPQFQVEQLSQPYTIQAGTEFYIGYKVNNCTSSDYPIRIDTSAPCANPGVAKVVSAGETKVVNIGEFFEHNLFVFGMTKPVVAVGEPTKFVSEFAEKQFITPTQDLTFKLSNLALTEFSSVTYKYSINNGTAIEKTIPVQVAGNSDAVVTLPIELQAGYDNVKVNLLKVNDILSPLEWNASCLYIPQTAGFERKFVVENKTKLNDENAVYGVVAFVDAKANIPSFVGMNIHVDDELSLAEYQSFVTNYLPGAVPQAVINRDKGFVFETSAVDLIQKYELWKNLRAPAKIDVHACRGEHNNLDVETDVVFGFDAPAGRFALSYILVEDDVTVTLEDAPVSRAEGDEEPSEGDESEEPGENPDQPGENPDDPEEPGEEPEEPVTVTCNDVVMGVTSVTGQVGTLDGAIVGNKSYYNRYELSLDKVKNIDNCHIVALLLDKETGVIMNAATLASADFEETLSIANVAADNKCLAVGGVGEINIIGEAKSVEVYTLSGQSVGRTTSLARGLYIVRVDGKTSKIFVK